jgi:periplasmic protein CpxP/Spy
MKGLTMTPFAKRLLIATATVGVLASSAGVWAYSYEHTGCQGMDNGPRAERMQKKMGQHQQQLKAALKLTGEQETAWKDYSASLQGQKNAKPQLDRAEWAKLTTPERMDKMMALRTEREAHMRQRMDATKAFYATLTPQQQQVFDQHHSKMGRHGHGTDSGHGKDHKGHHGHS